MRTHVFFVLVLSQFAGLAWSQSAEDGKKWYELNQKAIPAARHLRVEVELQKGEKEFVRYRVDRLPNLARVHIENGACYVAMPNKPWLESGDWSYTGAPVDPGLADQITQYAQNINAPLVDSPSKDLSQGAKIWKPLGEETKNGVTFSKFEHTREHPHADGFYPIFTYARGEGDAFPVLQHCAANFRDGSNKLITAEFEYHVLTDEQSAAVRSAELTAEIQSLKAAMILRPLTVDGTFESGMKLHIRGVVDGVNSDLTVTRNDKTQRVIVHDGLAWLSEDEGKTWKAEPQALDRDYARRIVSPILYNGRSDLSLEGGRFEERERKTSGEGVEQYVKLGDPPGAKAVTETIEEWVLRRPNQPAILHRSRSPIISRDQLVTGKVSEDTISHVDVTYDYAPSTVHPPKGIKLRLPQITGNTKPAELLYKAKQNMAKQVRWKVSAKFDQEDCAQITGIVEGARSDLHITHKDGSVQHQIVVDDAQYVSTNDDKTWTRNPVNRDHHYLVSTPMRFRESEKIPPFEILEQHDLVDDGLVLHIRFRSAEAVNSDDDRNNYWLEVRADGSVLMKSYRGPAVYQGRYIYGTVEYELPGKDVPPVQAPQKGVVK